MPRTQDKSIWEFSTKAKHTCIHLPDFQRDHNNEYMVSYKHTHTHTKQDCIQLILIVVDSGESIHTQLKSKNELII